MLSELGALPLEGIRIIDLTTTMAGPLTTRVCAELGAEVIKIESLRRIDIMRCYCFPDNEPGDEWWNRGGYFHWLNWGKLSCTLNLDHRERVEIFKELIKTSDVLVENFSPRVKRNWGLDYSEIKKVNPKVIMVSLSGFGQTGPHGEKKAYAPTMEAASGFASLTGGKDDPPVLSSAAVADWAAGLFGVAAILLSLHYRRQTGHGVYIDLAGREALSCFMGDAILDYSVYHKLRDRFGNHHPNMVPHGVYACRGENSWIALAVRNDEEWQRFCRLAGDPRFAREEFSTLSGRLQNVEVIDRLVEEWSSNLDVSDAMSRLQAAGIPSGAVLTPKEMLLDPHFRQRGFFVKVEHPTVAGNHIINRSLPIEFDKNRFPSPAPILGEHNEYVFGKLLMFPKEKLEELEKEKVMGTVPLIRLRPQVYPLELMLRGGVCDIDAQYKEVLRIAAEKGEIFVDK